MSYEAEMAVIGGMALDRKCAAMAADALSPEMFSDQLSQVAEKEKQVVAALKAMLGIYAKVKLVAPKSIARSEGKAVRVIDKRKI